MDEAFVDVRERLTVAAIVLLASALASCGRGGTEPAGSPGPAVVADPPFVVQVTEPSQAAQTPAAHFHTVRGRAVPGSTTIERVDVAIARLHGESCRWLQRTRPVSLHGVRLPPRVRRALGPRLALGPRASCDHPTWFPAALHDDVWRFDARCSLSPGNYRVIARGAGGDGARAGDGVVFRLT